MREFRTLADEVRNWGRWGSDDQLGTLNLITEQKVQQAASLVVDGVVFPLGIAFGDSGPQRRRLRRNPLHTMTIDGGDARSFVEIGPGWAEHPRAQEVGNLLAGDLLRFNDDFIAMHLQSATQWDALSHVYYEDRMYNGFPAAAVTSFGASRLSIDQVDVKGVTSRGVLLDMVRFRGERQHCQHGEQIMPDELSAAADSQGVQIEVGDVVLVRTGWMTRFHSTGDTSTMSAGLSWRCASWIQERGLAALAADNPQVEDPVSGLEGNRLPLHLLCLRDMGLTFGEFWDLDALADHCAGDGRWDFQLVAPPLRITGAVGSPVNPVALK